MPIYIAAKGVARKLHLYLFATLFGLLLSSPALIAQTATGSIVGIVRDPSGRVVVGAQAHLLNVDKNQASETTTNDLGYYSFPLLQPALYQLTIQAPGDGTTGVINNQVNLPRQIQLAVKLLW